MSCVFLRERATVREGGGGRGVRGNEREREPERVEAWSGCAMKGFKYLFEYSV